MKNPIKLALLPAMMLVIGLTTCIQKSQAERDYSIKPYYENPGTEVGNKDKIKVLIVTGGHPFDREEFFALFQGYDDIEYEEFELKEESEVFEDVSSLDYDVMVLYNMTQEISRKRRDNFVRLLKEQGIGLVVVHHAEAAYQSWLEYHQIIGTAYIYTDVMIDGKLWLPHCTNKIGVDIPVYVRDNKHPITRGMKDFQIKEETYKGRWWAKDNHLLLSTDHPDNDEPLAWTRQYGRSRVFNVQFGHDKEGFASPEFRELIVRGIRWTAGVKQSSDFSPRNTGLKNPSADGVTVQYTSSETMPAVSINDIQKGLVAYWPLDNLSTTTPDLSGNRNHLQAINLTAADVVSGKKGNAISFNGKNSLLLCFAAKGRGLPACSHSASTVVMWVKGSTSKETGRVFSETTNAHNPLVAISTDRRAPEGVVDLYLRADNGNTLISHHRTSLVAFDNAWHHIAWVDDQGKIRLYVDGIQDTSRNNYIREPFTPTITALGGVMRFDTVRFAFQGLIDETAIWSRALTDTEIRLVMNKGLANFLPKTNSQSQNQIVVAKEQLNSATSSETVKDANGNIYHTMKVGTQLWTVEDLKTTKFNDGTPIPNVIEAGECKSLTAPGYCYYENNPENGKKYGVLYNWYAASSDKIAPKGWRVSTHDDQIALMDYLIDNGYNYDGTTEENKIGKSMAAKTDWIYNPTNEGYETLPDVGAVGKNTETNNSSGFSALPTGSRWNDGSFHSIGQSVYWWSTTSVNADDAHLSFIKIRDDKYGFIQHHKRSGFCVRLIRE